MIIATAVLAGLALAVVIATRTPPPARKPVRVRIEDKRRK